MAAPQLGLAALKHDASARQHVHAAAPQRQSRSAWTAGTGCFSAAERFVPRRARLCERVMHVGRDG